jgi:hypothetical protein
MAPKPPNFRLADGPSLRSRATDIRRASGWKGPDAMRQRSSTPRLLGSCSARTRTGQTRSSINLEDDFQGELGVVGFAGANARRAVLDTDGRGACAEQGPVSANVWTVIVRLRQVGAVENVEHFHTELRVDALLVDGYVLDQRQIHVSEARPDDLIAAKIAIGAARRNDEAVRVEVLRHDSIRGRLYRTVAVEGRADNAGAILALGRAAVI